MNLRVVGTVLTFLLVFIGLMHETDDVNVEEFFVFLGFGSIAGLIAWFKLFKPSSPRKDD